MGQQYSGQSESVTVSVGGCDRVDPVEGGTVTVHRGGWDRVHSDSVIV